MADQDTRVELNRLYWETDTSVSDIEERLGVSRRGIYDGIEPRPTGVLCKACQSPLVYRNRTSLENRRADCPECGAEVEIGPQEGLRPDTEPERFREAPAVSVRTVPDTGDGPILGLALIAGLAVGALLFYWVRRR